jgi:hypothetical protein
MYNKNVTDIEYMIKKGADQSYYMMAVSPALHYLIFSSEVDMAHAEVHIGRLGVKDIKHLRDMYHATKNVNKDLEA